MAFKDEFGNLGQRFDEFAARLEERTRSRPGKGAGNGGLDLRSILGTLRDLFTRDVTREGLRNLVKRDPRDILRFYTHEIDFESLRPLPWYKRYPGMAWKVFVATAYRLSPARRIAFAVAILAFFIGGIPPVPQHTDQEPGYRGRVVASHNRDPGPALAHGASGQTGS